MIQDIGSCRFDRTYRLTAPGPEDLALCYTGGRVLLRRNGEEWSLPRFGDFPEAIRPRLEDARHFFQLDGLGCYLADPDPAEEDLPDDTWAYRTYQQVRTVRPMETAFAAITGAQLDRWYRSRAFCGRCGTRMAPSQTERAMVCPACGQTEYPKICPAVIAAVTDGDRILVTRYAGRPYIGLALIAGFVEIGETLEDTVRREVMEEVGLRVKDLRYYKNQPWAFTDTLLTGFYCRLDGPDAITLDRSELKEALWMRRRELPPQINDISLTAEMIQRFRLGKEKEYV